MEIRLKYHLSIRNQQMNKRLVRDPNMASQDGRSKTDETRATTQLEDSLTLEEVVAFLNQIVC